MAEREDLTASNKLASVILFATVAAAPLPYGSVNPTAIAFWCIVLGIGLVVSVPRGLDRRHVLLLGLAALVVAAYAIVLHEQLARHPWIAEPNSLWRPTLNLLQDPSTPQVSIARNQPFYSLGAPFVAMLSLMCSFIVCANRDRARQLLQVVAWSGVAYAVYGILSHLIDPTVVLFREKTAYRSVLTATFINRNTAGVYFGSCSVVWLVLLSENVRRQLPTGKVELRKLLGQLLSTAQLDFLVSFSMFFICLAAMFMTGSRSGVVLSLLALVVTFTLYFRRDLPARSGVVISIVACGAIALVLLQIMGAGVSGRFDAEGLAAGGRLATYRSTLHMIADHPWFGTGQGTFAWSFPQYRSADVSLWGVWDRAHNTLLEVAADLGVPLALLVIVAWFVTLSVLVRGIRVRRHGLANPVVALAIAIIAILHSSIDFSLQIPGYTIVVFALIGAGLAQSYGTNGQTSKPGVSKSAKRPTESRS